jgi:hypothetical protein
MQDEDDRKGGKGCETEARRGKARALGGHTSRTQSCLQELNVLAVDVFGMGDAPSSTAIELTA